MASSLILNSTINKYIRQVTEGIARRRKFLAALMSNGRVKYNESGKLLDWKVRHKRTPLQDFGTGDAITFSVQDKHKTATLPMRSYVVEKAIYKGDKLQNKGTEAIVKLWSDAVSELMDDIKDHFCEELINTDGDAAGNERKIHGLETVFADISSANANGYIGTPAGTYAGLNMALASYGGTWTGNWPGGYGDSHYDFWSPLFVDVKDTLWGGGASPNNTWKNNCTECLHYGITHTERNGDELDLILLERGYYLDFINTLDDKERIQVRRGSGDSLMKKMGSRDVINQDGVDITWEHGITASRGYGFSYDNITLHSWQPQLFVSTSDFDIETFGNRVAVDFYGNLRVHSPRGLVRFGEITA